MNIETTLCILGGGIGGSACALAACQSGLKVVLTEPTDWIGGQWTAQATPPDEHGWIESHGCTAAYRQFRASVRAYYRQHYPLTQEAANNPLLNPGNGWVSPLCAAPKVFLAVLEELLAPFVEQGLLTILKKHIPIAADADDEFVHRVVVQNIDTHSKVYIKAAYFADATELGDVLALTHTEYVTGAESQADTGEPHAKPQAQPRNIQAFSMCFAMSYHEGEDYTIPRPQQYSYWRDFIPALQPAWSGKLLSLTGINPRTLQPVHYKFQPNQEANQAFAGLWTYRRILHTEHFIPHAFDSDITLVNYPQIDYLCGDLIEATPEQRLQHIENAKQQSLSFLYYLQTELGWKGLKLRPDVLNTHDGLAKAPYIRESRRIKAIFTIVEQHISAQYRPGCRYAARFHDSIGIGYYRIDLHPSLGGDNYIDVESLPFQIPLGALIPIRKENLLPACKNIGTTHITNGCYRLHPIEWNIGESVGYLLAFCLKKQVSPRKVRNTPQLLKQYQQLLKQKGIETSWKKGLKLSEGDPHRHAMKE